METQFRPIPPKQDYDKEVVEERKINIDDEFKNSKRQLMIKRTITRIVAFLILALIIFLFFIRKPSKQEAPKVDTQIPVQEVKEEPVIKEEVKTEKVTSLITTLSPVQNKKTPTKNKLSANEYDGFVTLGAGDAVFNTCAGNEDLLLVHSSPLYAEFHNRFSFLTKDIYFKKSFVVLKGHKVPISYEGLGNSYTQGFFIDGITKIELNGNCY